MAAPALPPAAAGAVAAAKYLALHAAPYLDLTTLSSASFAAVLLRYYWKNKVPDWVKEDVAFQNLLRRKKVKEIPAETEEPLSASEREEREMANLSSILEKLQRLVESVQFNDNHPSTLQLHAALLAYIQLSAQIKKQEQIVGVLTQQEQQTSELEENKDENHASLPQDPDQDLWSSRDSLYNSAKPSKATINHAPQEYYDFVENPSESPVLETLQQALTFATWAYYGNADILSDKLAQVDFSLLTHSMESRPGHVAYYMAVSSIAKKQIVIGVRGTSTLEDMVTDCCGRPVAFDDRPYYYEHDRGTKRNFASNSHDPARIEVRAATPNEIIHNEEEQHVEVVSGHERIWVEQESTVSDSIILDNNQEWEGHSLRCHEGIMVSAKRLVDKLQDRIEYWVLERGYQLVLCGHSLGAGCSALAAVILRSRLPELAKGPDAMCVFAFAPPPVLDYHSAMAASSYCTSIVNNADIIPRSSLSNLLILLEILKTVLDKLNEQGLAPTGAKGMAAFVKKIAQGPEGEMLMTSAELRQAMQNAMFKVQEETAASACSSQTINNQREQKKEKISCCTCGCGCGNEAATLSMDEEETDLNEKDVATESAQAVSEANSSRKPLPLFIPGVVLLAHEPWCSPTNTKCKDEIEDTAKTERTGPHDSDKKQLFQRTKWTVTDGTANVLHFLEFENFTLRMLTDHATTSYYTALDLVYEF